MAVSEELSLGATAEASDGEQIDDEDSDEEEFTPRPHQIHAMSGQNSEPEMSGYDTDPRDPVERSNLVFKWQRQMQNLQNKIRNTSRTRPKDTPKTSLRERVRTSQKKIVSTLRERNQKWRNRTEDRLKAFNKRIEKVLSKMRMRKVRQMRHIFCFVCSMVNLVIMSFWLGRWPQTFHWWYTINCLFLIGCRAVWYRWHNYHYFLLDLCYWVNATLLMYIWFFNDNEWLFQGIYGFSGVLMISVPLFRNSFVPHSLDRVTSYLIHTSPVVQLWVIRWPNEDQAQNWQWKLPEEFSVFPAFTLYLSWAILYYGYIFVIRGEVIHRRGYETLYKHMAVDMGLANMLPKKLQGARTTKVVFMCGHFLLFVSGILAVHLPYWIHTVCVISAFVWGFKNGAQFYMTYFWRVYEDQITAFERQREMLQEEQKQSEMISRATGAVYEDKSQSTTDVPAPNETLEAEDDLED